MIHSVNEALKTPLAPSELAPRYHQTLQLLFNSNLKPHCSLNRPCTWVACGFVNAPTFCLTWNALLASSCLSSMSLHCCSILYEACLTVPGRVGFPLLSLCLLHTLPLLSPLPLFPSFLFLVNCMLAPLLKNGWLYMQLLCFFIPSLAVVTHRCFLNCLCICLPAFLKYKLLESRTSPDMIIYRWLNKAKPLEWLAPDWMNEFENLRHCFIELTIFMICVCFSFQRLI